MEDKLVIDAKEEMIMKLVHYFVTIENYTPIVVNGVKNEIWLENLDNNVRIVRINSNYIHNIEQLDFDIFKIKRVCQQIKKKTMTYRMNVMNLQLNLNDNLKVIEDKIISSYNVGEIDDVTNNKDILEVFPNIQNDIITDMKGVDLFMNITKDINENTERKNEIYESIFKKKKVFFTPLIIGICIVMFIITTLSGGLQDTSVYVDFGAVFGPYIKEGEYWRLLTGTFLHADVLHISFNLYALYMLGNQVESFFGKWKFLGIYLISAISGSLLSITFNTGVSIGASGAIFGLLGALAYFGWHNRVYFGSVFRSQIVPIILLNLVIGFMSPGIDNAAHIGGLVGGFFAAMAVGYNKNQNTKSESVNGIILTIALLGFFIFTAFFMK